MKLLDPSFNNRDAETWPLVLTIEHIAAIYGRSVRAIQHALAPSTSTVFTPYPYRKLPYRWRKVDVLRDVEGNRGLSAVRRSA